MRCFDAKGGCLGVVGYVGDIGGPDGGGGWLIWWLEGAKQGWTVAAVFWSAACVMREKGRGGEESLVDLFHVNFQRLSWLDVGVSMTEKIA